MDFLDKAMTPFYDVRNVFTIEAVLGGSEIFAVKTKL